ncbi:MAG: flagellar basal body rod protein FlgF [Gammaproteobacteria bacterium]
MDKLIYVAMTGARETLRSQSAVSHNLSNINTPGFRSVQHSMQSAPIDGAGLPTRVNSVMAAAAWNDRAGSMLQTGRALDVAVQGEGWLTVQGPDGEEAFTRAGNLRVSPTGLLETPAGQLVLGNSGPISIPQFQRIDIANDGRISIVPVGSKPNGVAEVDQLKLVNPPRDELQRGENGLFRRRDGEAGIADPAVRIASGQLEASNVNAAQSLVEMIELSRRFEMQVRSMNQAEQMDEAATRLMRMSG